MLRSVVSSVNRNCFASSTHVARHDSVVDKKVNQLGSLVFSHAQTSLESKPRFMVARLFHSSSLSAQLLTPEDLKTVYFHDEKGKPILINTVSDAIRIFSQIKENRVFLNDGGETFNPWIPAIRFPLGIWTRGASNIEHRLTPGVFRLHEGYYNETSMVYSFQYTQAQYSNFHKTHFEWLSLMEHYFVYSRLLNWTQNLLVSLFFATNPDCKGKQQDDGAIWILNAQRLNERGGVLNHNKWGVAVPGSFNVDIRAQMSVTNDLNAWIKAMRLFVLNGYDAPQKDDFDGFLDFIENNKALSTSKNGKWNYPVELEKLLNPVAVMPRVLSERLRSQQGIFTIHSGKIYEEDLINPESTVSTKLGVRRIPKGKDLFDLNRSRKTEETFLRVVKIPLSAKERIRQELFTLGIHEGVIYPELEHQHKKIHEFHLHKK